ncbi:uncharacterized protein BKA55DRAFT_657564 [Fusarium redolens]|uniref:Hemerythrin-like domain-containing protein n=1 Tax=Fusarium redolens TaxID=48865 RepID=A0A9P9FYH7_FUSRE|nr:uncharacterized protein BKA55DRAFT_657564 [Fusarium redolens]KAH7205799.1 hypothetical protein BKA55DRAFT_657564 [Fusarium redolens]
MAPLTDAEFKAYNRLAEKMENFHGHFKRTWRFLEKVCEAEDLPDGIRLVDLINEGLSFCMSLEMHHNIEETYFFPLLARRMREFQVGNESPLLEQHRVIHKGLQELNNYLSVCRTSQSHFNCKSMKSKMSSWSDVLWEHLDDEVQSLGAENMRRYWTVDEMNHIYM